jgi:hypothetical protein
MAGITGTTEEKVFQIKEWKGLNESPDGDTKLAMGEAAVMRNFRVTRDGNLQRRPGLALLMGLMTGYTLAVEDTAKAVRTDTTAASKLTMHKTAEATEDGHIELSMGSDVVTYENAGDHTGWYWRYSDDYVYQLEGIENAGDTRQWMMRRVTAQPTAAAEPVRGLWAGNVQGTEYVIAACDGHLWKVNDGTDWCKEDLGELDTSGTVHFFGYSENLYILNGKQYLQWDGETLKEVEGYRPLVTVAVVPEGGGTTLEQVNKLNGMRRCWFSPDGESTTFQLPETGIKSLDYVKTLATGEEMDTEEYTADLEAGTVTFASAPDRGVSSIEIGWTMAETFRETVEAMRFSETYSGTTDNRVFLYGDGSNQAFYSGLDYDGKPRADYFPDLNVLDVGEANTPITALIRHFSRLIVFKESSTYSITYGTTTLADSSTTAAFYATPVNRSIGNAAPGQVRLVLNNPRTLFGRELYEWKNNSAYNSNLTNDERQAVRISDRIHSTLGDFSAADSYCWDDNDNQEFYICHDGKALVNNYATDAWYYYENFPAACMVNFRGDLYIGTSKGELVSFSYENRTDQGEEISAYWESGSLSFERDFMRKYSAMLWVGIKPEERGEVYVTVQTDKKSQYTEKIVSSSLIAFDPADFRKWSFNTNRKPHMTRTKIKAKKFVFYKLIFKTASTDTTVTVLSADMRVRYTGYAR